MSEKGIIRKCKAVDCDITTINKGVQDDLFLSCISYEPRSVGVLEKLNKEYRATTGLFVINKKFQNFSKVQENKMNVNNALEKFLFFKNTDYILTSIDNPIKIIIEIDKILKRDFQNKKSSGITITLDITAFPRCELLPLIYYLRHLSYVNSIRILYACPEGYGNWLSKGYKYSTIPPFFEGPPTFEKKTGLLLLTGFEYDRAIALIDDLEPSTVIIGRPIPGTSSNFVNKSDKIIDKLKQTRKVKSQIYDIPADNPFLCKKLIEEIIEQQSKNFDFYVSTMGTKLEVLGTYLAYEAGMKNPKFRVIYPIPLAYNVGDYSYGIEAFYQFSL